MSNEKIEQIVIFYKNLANKLKPYKKMINIL